jgi:tetratricopeptide (TPR) repeat protein
MAAMFSKEVVIMFPFWLLIREALDRPVDEPLNATLKRLASRTAGFFAAAAFYLAARYQVLGFLSKVEPHALGISDRDVVLTIPSVLLRYMRMLLLPYPLAIVYPTEYVTSPADARFWASALALGALAVIVGRFVRGSAVGVRAAAWLLLFLLPVLNLKAFNVMESLVHDRYLYLPSVGFCLLLALALERLSAASGARQQQVFLIATLAIAVAYFGLTAAQNRSWHDDLAMTERALSVSPNRAFLYNYLGAYYQNHENLGEAEHSYAQAIQYRPTYYDAYSNLGDVYREQGKLAEAEQAYRKAIELGAPYADTYFNLAVVLTGERKLAEAERYLLGALKLQPVYAKAHYNLGWVLENEAKNAPAEQEYRRALEQDPFYVEPRINLAVLLTKEGQYTDALRHLDIARQLAPDHPVMLFALGDLYMRMERYEDATTPLRRLADRDPRHRLVHTSLGLCYEKAGRYDQARDQFQQAIAVAPDDPWTAVARQHLAALGN